MAPNPSSDGHPAPSAAEMEPPAAFGPDLARHWMLDPAIDFLNHGSFGATPHRVAEAQAAWRQRIEARPIAMLGRESASLLAVARKAVASLVGADADDLGFVTNATEGVNAFLNGISLVPGDELVTTDHVYNAVRQAMRHRAASTGATVREVPLPLPVRGPQEILERIDAVLNDRTRLLVIDHVTSPTALRLPVEAIATRCAERGIELLVDGAHAPGMLPVDLEALGRAGVSAYAANLHKWVCGAKGAAFLWVRRELQPRVHPTTISHFLGQGFTAEFAWQGTRDITAWLTTADAIRFLEELGLDALMAHNRAMAVWVQSMLCNAWRVEPISPMDGSMLGSMATVPLPAALQPDPIPDPIPDQIHDRQFNDRPESDPGRRRALETLQATLYGRYHIEVPLVDFANRWHVRPSCQVYNDADQYRRLAAAVDELARD